MTDDAQDGDRSRWPAIYGPAEPGIACLGFVLLLTPTWSLPSPRWRAAILRYRLCDLDRILSRTLPTACSPCCWRAATPRWS